MDIADIISRAESAAIPKQRCGPGRKRSVFLTAEQRDRFNEMWHDGTVSLKAIAKEFDVCPQTAESLGVQYGYPPRSGFRVAWRRGNPSPASPKEREIITVACPQCGQSRSIRVEGKKAADKAATRLCRLCHKKRNKRQRGLRPGDLPDPAADGLSTLVGVNDEEREKRGLEYAIELLVDADWVPLKRLEYENMLNKMQRLERENEDLRAKESSNGTKPGTLSEWLNANPPGAFKPQVSYFQDGDFTTYFARDEMYRAEQIDGRFTVYLSESTGNVIGFKIAGRTGCQVSE